MISSKNDGHMPWASQIRATFSKLTTSNDYNCLSFCHFIRHFCLFSFFNNFSVHGVCMVFGHCRCQKLCSEILKTFEIFILHLDSLRMNHTTNEKWKTISIFPKSFWRFYVLNFWSKLSGKWKTILSFPHWFWTEEDCYCFGC